MDDDTRQETEQRLKAAIWYTVGKMCREAELELNAKISPQFIASLSDVVYKQAGHLAVDLEHFAKHAKRSVISMEDVKLCARRNDSLHEIISDDAQRLADQMAKEKEAKKRRK